MGSGGASTSLAWGVPLSQSGNGDTGGGGTDIPPVLVNPGFETPAVSGWESVTGGAGVGWSTLGISGNGSAYTGGNPGAPEGVQVAILQVTGSFYQPVSFGVGGTLQVSFYAAQRENYQSSYQTFGVTLGSTPLGTFNPAGTSYESFTTDAVEIAAGTYDLTFTGLNPEGGDNTAFLDDVQIAFTPASGGGDSVADNPFGYLGGLGYWQDPALADSGLSYARQRWLENGSGQWLSVDPVATEPRYGYARNSPTMRVDPSGTQAGGTNQAPSSGPSNRSDNGGFAGFAQSFIRSTDASDAAVQHFLSMSEDLWQRYVEWDASLEERTIQFLGNLPGGNPFAFMPLTTTQWQWLTAHLPQCLQPFAPPRPESADYTRWNGGLISGVVGSLAQMLNETANSIAPDHEISQLLKLVLLLMKGGGRSFHGFWSAVGTYAQQNLQSFFSLFGDNSRLSQYQRGKVTGIVVVSVVSLLLIVYGTLEALATAYEAGANFASSIVARFGSYRTPDLVLTTPEGVTVRVPGRSLKTEPEQMAGRGRTGNSSRPGRPERPAATSAETMDKQAVERRAQEMIADIIKRTGERPNKDILGYPKGYLLPDDIALAKKINGLPNRGIEGLPNETEFDALSEKYVAQSKSNSRNAIRGGNAQDFIDSEGKQIRISLQLAQRTSRIALFEFKSEPLNGVTKFILDEAKKIGARVKIITVNEQVL